MGLSFDQQISFIYTRDMDRAAAFYENVLGLDLVLVQQGGCRIYRTAPGAFLGICKERPDRVSNQDGLVICLVSQDVDGWHDRLSDAGIAIETPPTYSEVFGVYHIFLRDPDGHLVEIQRFDDADWHEPLDGGA